MRLTLILTLACLALGPLPGLALADPPLTPSSSTTITRVWANDGGDKVTRDELRASTNPNSVTNSIWNGSRVAVFGARNETVSFNLVLECPSLSAAGVNVAFSSLSGAGGAISSRPASGEGVFNYVGRNIELFFVRYLQIRGLSTDLAYEVYDERHVPRRCRRPWTGAGDATGGWTNRSCHDKYYPDIAVPLELAAPFAIQAGSNQSIW